MEIWRRKGVVEYKPGDMNDLSHDIRNAVLGLQLQRKQALQCISQACRAFLAMDEHFQRIESALLRTLTDQKLDDQ